jgi:hypothetical protein
MGTVYLAHDPHLDRLVALKVPQLQFEGSPVLLERFLREARAAATLTHPNICPVYDAGQADGVPFLAMGFVEGRPLSELARGHQLPERAVAAIVRQLALAMQHAHDKGIIHRDLKPANVMIAPNNQPVVMDFGLARKVVSSEAETRLTQAGAIMGTPAYMSPEQVKGDLAAIGPASDIYSLGVILYELLAGRIPFMGPVGVVMVQIALDPPPPISEFRPGVDRALQGIAQKALEKQPADRFASMAEFAAALSTWLKGTVPVAVQPVPVVITLPAAPQPEQTPGSVFADIADQVLQEEAPDPAPQRDSGGRAVLWLVAGVLTLCAAVVVLWLAFGRSPTNHRSPETAQPVVPVVPVAKKHLPVTQAAGGDQLPPIGPADLERFPVIVDTKFDTSDNNKIGKEFQDGQPVSERGFAMGRHFMTAEPNFLRWWNGYGTADSTHFAVRVVGRTVGPQPGLQGPKRWDGWVLAPAVDDSARFPIRIDSVGALHIEPSESNTLGIDAAMAPIYHKAIKPHVEFNTLVVICRGRHVDVFVNGERVRDTLTLERPLGPGAPLLGVRTGSAPVRVEFERFTLWSLPVTDAKFP